MDLDATRAASLFFIILVGALIFTHSVAAQTNLVIHIDESGIATFSGNGTNSSALPDGIIYENGTISGSTAAVTKKNNELWTFSFSMRNSSMEVYLPELAVVKEIDGQLVADASKQIKVYGNNTLEVTYTLPTQTVVAQADRPRSLIIGLSLVFLVVVGGLVIFGWDYIQRKLQLLSRKKRRPKQSAEKKFMLITQLLNAKENHILGILRERGPMKSSYLQRMSEIPKSSFFRNLQELEKKRLITRSGAGRNKIIELTIH